MAYLTVDVGVLLNAVSIEMTEIVNAAYLSSIDTCILFSTDRVHDY